MTTIRAHCGGKAILPDEGVGLPINQPLKLHESETTAAKTCPTRKDFAESGLFGMWKDRPEVGDSLDVARELRRRSETRHHQNDDAE